MHSPEDLWYVLHYGVQFDGSVGKIIITTNRPCHLVMVYKNKAYTKRRTWLTIRGERLKCDLGFALTKPWSKEQQEPGFTLIHTFIIPVWAVCETMYFYFTGSTQTGMSPSQSAIFPFHRGSTINTLTFYPEPDPAPTACDGYVGRWLVSEYYTDLRVNPGNVTDTPSPQIQCAASYAADIEYLWHTIYRGIFKFNVSAIPPQSLINLAILRLFGMFKFNTFTPPLPVYLNIFNAYTQNHTFLVPADYNTCGWNPLSNQPISYDEFQVSLTIPAPNTFVLNSYGNQLLLNAINGDGIFTLCSRDNTYDAPGHIPLWEWLQHFNFVAWSSEKGGDFRPKLEVTFQPPT